MEIEENQVFMLATLTLIEPGWSLILAVFMRVNMVAKPSFPESGLGKASVFGFWDFESLGTTFEIRTSSFGFASDLPKFSVGFGF